MGDMGESRFLRKDLGADGIGMANYRMNPEQRIGFGHTHGEAEEVYLVLAGSGRFKIDDDIVEVGPKDVVYCPPGTMRAWESGPDGMELARVRPPRQGRLDDRDGLVGRRGLIAVAGAC